MRTAFNVALLCVACLYAYVAFVDLNFLSSTGRLGPGFFPRIIAVLAILACLYQIFRDLRGEHEPLQSSAYLRTVLAVMLLTFLLILSLNFLGGALAMVAFMLAMLFFLNPGRIAQNLAVGISLPVLLYLMFDVWLEAPLPEGALLAGWLG